ncbi:MAG: hypothetical protein LBT46_12415 [Planctomycetaceae bacterium]|jgi:hypothetical protein|nr:hypothetical protein [Planctomycetaceae bacterium]
MKRTAVSVVRDRVVRQFVVLLAGLFCAGCAAADTLSEAVEIERKCVENRMKMQQWHIVYTTNLVDKERPVNETPHIESWAFPIEVETWYDGKRHRRDDVCLKTQKGEMLPRRDTLYFDGVKVCLYASGIDEMGRRRVLHTQKPEDPVRAAGNFFDARTLGMNFAFFDIEIPITDIFTNTNPHFVRHSIAEESLDGVLCKKIAYTLKYDAGSEKVSCWFAVSQGYSVRRFEGEVGDGLAFIQGNTQVKEYKNSGIWYPYHFEYQQRDAKGDISVSQDVKVDIVSLNEPLDDYFFSLKSLNPPPGTMFSDPDNSGQGNFYWNGEEVVSEGALGHQFQAENHNDNNDGGAKWYLLIALNLLVIGLYCLYFYYTKNK